MNTHEEARRESMALLRRIRPANHEAAEAMRSYHKRTGNKPTSLRNCLHALARLLTTNKARWPQIIAPDLSRMQQCL